MCSGTNDPVPTTRIPGQTPRRPRPLALKLDSGVGLYRKAVGESEVAISDGSIENESEWGMHKKLMNNEEEYTNPLKIRNLSALRVLPQRIAIYPVCPILLGYSKTQIAPEDRRFDI